MNKRHFSVSLKDLIDAGLLQPGQELRYQAPNRALAHITSEGFVHLDGINYHSLSSAAKHITGYPVNGWIVWQIKSETGDWIAIAHVRKRLSGPHT